MKNFDWATYGVAELNAQEMEEVNGGDGKFHYWEFGLACVLLGPIGGAFYLLGVAQNWTKIIWYFVIMFEELTITEQENISGGELVIAIIAFFCYQLGKD